MDVPLDRLTEQDLQRLIEAGAAESLLTTSSRHTAAPSLYVELLADVSSFANTAGGDIVIGMAERQGRSAGVYAFHRRLPTRENVGWRTLHGPAWSRGIRIFG